MIAGAALIFFQSMYFMKTHIHDFFQIFSAGGHSTTAKKPKICNLRFYRRGQHPKKSEKNHVHVFSYKLFGFHKII